MLTARGVDGALRQIGPLWLHSGTAIGATRDIVGAVLRKQPLQVAFANTHLLYCALREPGLADTLERFYVVNDGIGVEMLARALNGSGFPENLNGTDLTPRILAALPWGTRVLMVGARPGIIQRAATTSSLMWPQLDICGAQDGFEGRERALAELETLAPDVVLVGMGNPLQERWIEQAAAILPNKVFLGVGALFDFIAGAVPRAPAPLQRLKLEWAFRLAQEPKRLWRRYTVELLYIADALLRERTERPS